MVLRSALIILCGIGVSTPILPISVRRATDIPTDIPTATHSSPMVSPLLVDAGYGRPDEVDDMGQEPTPALSTRLDHDILAYREELIAGNLSWISPGVEMPPDLAPRTRVPSHDDPTEFHSSPLDAPADAESESGSEDESGGEDATVDDVEVIGSDLNETGKKSVKTMSVTLVLVLVVAFLAIMARALGVGLPMSRTSRTISLSVSRTADNSNEPKPYQSSFRPFVVLLTILMTITSTATIFSIAFLGNELTTNHLSMMKPAVSQVLGVKSPSSSVEIFSAYESEISPSSRLVKLDLESESQRPADLTLNKTLSTSMITHERYGVVILTGDGHMVLNQQALNRILQRMIETGTCLIDSAEYRFISPEQRSDLRDQYLEIRGMIFNGGMTKEEASESLLQAANNDRAARLFVLRRGPQAMIRVRNERVNEHLRDMYPSIFERFPSSSKVFDDSSEAIGEFRSNQMWEDLNGHTSLDYFRTQKDPSRFPRDDVQVYMMSNNDGDYDMMDDPGPPQRNPSAAVLARRVAEDERQRRLGDNASEVGRLTSGVAAMASPSAGQDDAEFTGERRITRSSFYSPGGGTDDSAETAPPAPSKEDNFPEECEHDDSLVVFAPTQYEEPLVFDISYFPSNKDGNENAVARAVDMLVTSLAKPLDDLHEIFHPLSDEGGDSDTRVVIHQNKRLLENRIEMTIYCRTDTGKIGYTSSGTKRSRSPDFADLDNSQLLVVFDVDFCSARAEELLKQSIEAVAKMKEAKLDLKESTVHDLTIDGARELEEDGFNIYTRLAIQSASAESSLEDESNFGGMHEIQGIVKHFMGLNAESAIQGLEEVNTADKGAMHEHLSAGYLPWVEQAENDAVGAANEFLSGLNQGARETVSKMRESGDNIHAMLSWPRGKSQARAMDAAKIIVVKNMLGAEPCDINSNTDLISNAIEDEPTDKDIYYANYNDEQLDVGFVRIKVFVAGYEDKGGVGLIDTNHLVMSKTQHRSLLDYLEKGREWKVIFRRYDLTVLQHEKSDGRDGLLFVVPPMCKAFYSGKYTGDGGNPRHASWDDYATEARRAQTARLVRLIFDGFKSEKFSDDGYEVKSDGKLFGNILFAFTMRMYVINNLQQHPYIGSLVAKNVLTTAKNVFDVAYHGLSKSRYGLTKKRQYGERRKQGGITQVTGEKDFYIPRKAQNIFSRRVSSIDDKINMFFDVLLHYMTGEMRKEKHIREFIERVGEDWIVFGDYVVRQLNEKIEETFQAKADKEKKEIKSARAARAEKKRKMIAKKEKK